MVSAEGFKLKYIAAVVNKTPRQMKYFMSVHCLKLRPFDNVNDLQLDAMTAQIVARFPTIGMPYLMIKNLIIFLCMYSYIW